MLTNVKMFEDKQNEKVMGFMKFCHDASLYKINNGKDFRSRVDMNFVGKSVA